MRVVQGATAGAGAVAQPDIAAGFFAQHVGEILGPHGRQFVRQDVGGAKHILRHFLTEPCFGGAVNRRRIAVIEQAADLRAVGGGDAAAQTFDGTFHRLLHFGLEAADGAAQQYAFRNHVPGMAGVNLRHAHHGRIAWVQVAADHGLQGLHQLRGGDDGVHPLLRHGGMATVAADFNFKAAGAGHDRAGHHCHLADRNARPVMQAEHRLHRKLLEQAVFDHHGGTAFRFLRWLENEHHRAVEIGLRRQMPCRTEQHGGMPVVAAGVHLAGLFRVVRKFIQFCQRQGVHVRPQADHARRVTCLEYAHHAGFRQAAMHFQTVAFQFARHDVGGARFLKGQLRMRVQIAAQGGQFVDESVGGGRHGGSPEWCYISTISYCSGA